MSTSERFIAEYVGDQKFLDILRAILDINYYEAMSFVAIALTNESTASRIADITGIPRSKIYLTLNSLEEKKFIERTKDNYKIIDSQIFRLQGLTEDLTKGFQKFIKKVTTYYEVPSKIALIILETIKKILTKIGYHYFKPELRNIQNTMTYHRLNEISYLDIARNRDIRIEAIEKLRPTSLIHLVEFIAESSTSGAKVSIIVLTKEKIEEFGEIISNAIYNIAELLRTEASLIVVFPDVDLRILKKPKYDDGHTLHIIPGYETNFEEKIISILTDLDRNWRESKRELDNIGSEIQELKRTLTSTLDTTYGLKRDVRSIEKYSERYSEILNRIENDLMTSDDLLSDLRGEYEQLSRRLEAHRRFPSGSVIKDIHDKTIVLRESVQRKIQAQDQLSEDLISYLKGEKKYAEYGFSTNPFVFTVPPEYPEKIVNQKEAQNEMNSFIENMAQGSSMNFLFLVADEGRGKTHTLNFFANKINNGKSEKCIALRLNCRPKSDFIDLYPQIQMAFSRTKKEGISTETIAKIFEASGAPKSITDFLRVIREINSYLATSGIKGVFLLIDDFETTIPSEESRITPRSILQFRDLVRLENIGFIIAIRENYWNTWCTEIGKMIPRSIKPNIVHLRKFSQNETLELLNNRLLEYQDLKPIKKPPQFTAEVVEKICKITDGVPRQIIVVARELFRVAVSEGREITPELIKETTRP